MPFSESSVQEEEEDESQSESTVTDSKNWDNSTDAGGSSIRLQADTTVSKLGKKETNAIRAWRIFIISLIVVIGVGVTTAAWFYLTNVEESSFTEGYAVFARSVQDSSLNYVTELHHATRNLAQAITVISQVQNQTFPFVTINMYETLARHARQQSGIEWILYSPLVSDAQRQDWEAYSVSHQDWIADSQNQYVSSTDFLTGGQDAIYGDSRVNPIYPFIWDAKNDSSANKARVAMELNTGPYLPFWQVAPLSQTGSFHVNMNQLNAPYLDESYFAAAGIAREGIFTGCINLTEVSTDTELTTQAHVDYHQQFTSTNLTVETAMQLPHAYLIEPVFERIDDRTANVVGYLLGLVPWDRYLTRLVPETVTGLYVVLKNSCEQSYTFYLSGKYSTFVGPGDLHDQEFNYTNVEIPLYSYLNPNVTEALGGHCQYSMVLYASSDYESQTISQNLPAVVTVCSAAIFTLVAIVFVLYDCFVERRNSILVEAAEKSHSILSSLFPQNVRDRLFADHNEAEEQAKLAGGGRVQNLRSFVSGGMQADAGEEDDEMGYKGKPIADLFTESTVLFADIAGFTAWSSQREPAQVFQLLETLYRAFDEIATKRRVFKVETIGDCYVAVTGVPEPQKEHAVIMCRFAKDMMHASQSLTKRLETTLGPDTGDLGMRIGIHSGPVTAGVLRGERSRFQLFGDTMNTASRTESTGLKGKIQISQETADLLISSGKAHWLTQREEKVVAKGKGEMQTYWLGVGSQSTGGPSQTASSEQDTDERKVEDVETEEKLKEKEARVAAEKKSRLVAWNSDVLLRLLKQIIARRKASRVPLEGTGDVDEDLHIEHGNLVIDEVIEIIPLPSYDKHSAAQDDNVDAIEIEQEVVDQLYEYVANIAAMYRDNHFHNFEHASHVTMSVTKLLSRIVAPSNIDDIEESGKSLHDHTYGITNDPLTQFACVYSALIHDVDHLGVPNTQLVLEKSQIAQYYKNKSPAEQNSIDLSWQLLMDDSYSALRRKLYTNDAEFKRFRHLVVNSVMATDIMDKDLKTLRNKRWANAFSDTSRDDETKEAIDRKATIVIEHLIQASDVAHTMQHWHIYRKWNERFFFECYKAYKDGRAANDPSESWYKGEMGFYDFYIIPLARKLKDCGVFGVSSDEYLNYAQRNRQEWEAKGQVVVQEMVEKVHKEIGRKIDSV